MMSSLQTSDDQGVSLEYRGESKPRNIQVAFFITMLCPGLGYMYVGKLLKGLTINLLFILWVEIFVILQSVLKFFPLLPFLVFLISWLVFAAFAAFDVKATITGHGDEDSESYLLKSYNHWLPYSLMVVLSFLLPIFLSIKVTAESMWVVDELEHSGMYPTLMRGDVVLIDRGGFAQRTPTLGDLVAISWSIKEGSPIHILRAIAKKGDTIRVEGDMLYIDDQAIEQEPVTLPATIEPPEGMLTLTERNRTQRYVITMSPRTINRTSIPPTKIEANQLYLLSDNRSQVPIGDEKAKIRDSRELGPVGFSKIRGRPRYILWSTDPKTRKTRFERIGLKLF